MSFHTLNRLKAIQPGQRFVVYTGDLDSDIATSAKTPKYAALLTTLQAAMEMMKACGRIRVTKTWTEIELPKARNGRLRHLETFVYEAEGI